MNFFEETAQTKQPYAAVDSPPVLTYEDMEGSFDENIDDAARGFARDIYEHWKRRRLETGNRLLTIGLKVRSIIVIHFEPPLMYIHSLKQGQTQTMPIHMFVSGGEKLGRSVKHVEEMPIVRKNSRNLERNSKNQDKS